MRGFGWGWDEGEGSVGSASFGIRHGPVPDRSNIQLYIEGIQKMERDTVITENHHKYPLSNSKDNKNGLHTCLR